MRVGVLRVFPDGLFWVQNDFAILRIIPQEFSWQ